MWVSSAALILCLRNSFQRTVVDSIGVVEGSTARDGLVSGIVQAVGFVVSKWLGEDAGIAILLCLDDGFDVFQIAEAEIFARALSVAGRAVDHSFASGIGGEDGGVGESGVVGRVVQIDAFVASREER